MRHGSGHAMRLGSRDELARPGDRFAALRRPPPLVVHAGVNFAGQAVYAGSALLASILATRALGRSDRGVLALLVLVPTLLQMLLDLGVEQGLMVRMVKGSLGAPGRRPLLRGLAAHGAIGAAVAAVVAVLAPLAGSTTLASLGGQNAPLVAAACALAVAQHDLSGLLYGYKKVPFVSLARMGAALAVTAASAVLYWRGRDSVGEYFTVHVAGLACVTGALALRLRALLPRPPRPAGGSVDWPLVARTGLPFYGASLSNFVVARFDSFLLGATRPPAELGLYSAAVNLAEVLWYFPGALGQVLLPHTGAKGDARLCRRTLLAVALLSLASMLVVGTGGRLLITTLFGPSFSAAFTPLLLLLPGAVGMSCFRIGEVWLLIYGRVAAVRAINAVTAGGGVALWWLTIPRYGLHAAAAVSSVLYCSMGIVTTVALVRMTRR
jgi:O-antigen/teichoic acid export membrane protein